MHSYTERPFTFHKKYSDDQNKQGVKTMWKNEQNTVCTTRNITSLNLHMHQIAIKNTQKRFI